MDVPDPAQLQDPTWIAMTQVERAIDDVQQVVARVGALRTGLHGADARSALLARLEAVGAHATHLLGRLADTRAALHGLDGGPR